MNTPFTASNGDTIETRPGGDLVVKSGNYTEWVEPFAVAALREYFTAERDTELGRWRDPENPNYLVYRIHPNIVRVIDERWGTKHDFGRFDSPEDFHARIEPEQYRAAVRYFAAHPEPKPWMDAAHEEVWEITANGDTGPALATTSNKHGHTLAFQFANGTLIEADSDEITAGRKLWPEPEESDDDDA